MKLSCLPVSLFSQFGDGRLDIPKWAAAAREIGFDGFDFSVMFVKNHTPTYLDELKKGIAEAGIEPVMVCTYPDFVHPDPAQRRREAAYLERDIAVASELGAKCLRVLAGQNHPGLDRKAAVGWAVDGLRAAAVAADEMGVVLAYENHAKPGAWHYIDYSFPPDIFLDVFNGVRDTSVMVNFDIGNATAECPEEGGEIALLGKVVDKLFTFHVSDMTERGKFSPTLVGTGVTPLREAFAFAKSRGWDGWLCIEEAGGLGMDGVKKAHDVIRDIWAKA